MSDGIMIPTVLHTCEAKAVDKNGDEKVKMF